MTSYRSVPAQTKPKDCEWTSIGDHVCHDGVAVSQDLLKTGQIKYGDWVYIEGIGLKRINDTMNICMKQHFDIWVRTYEEERIFDKRFGHVKLKVWIVKFKGE